MADERKLFADRVPQLAAETSSVDPLPYRRTLSRSEGDRWLTSVRSRWGVVKMEWHPMLDTPVPENVLVLEQTGRFAAGDESAMKTALFEMGAARVIEMREDGVHRAIDAELFFPWFTRAAEGIRTDESLAWIAYASHESTAAFGGSICPYLKREWSSLTEWRGGMS